MKSGTREILTSVGALFSARAIAPILRLPTIMVLSRILGITGLGNYQTAMAYYIVFESLTSLGLWTYTVREVAVDAKRASPILLHGCLLSLVTTIPGIGAMYFLGNAYTAEVGVGMLILGFALFPAGVSTFSEAVLMGFGRVQAVSAFLVAEELLLACISCTVLWLGYGLMPVLLSFALVRSLAAVARFWFATTCADTYRWQIQPGIIRELLANAPVFFTTAMFSSLFWRMDILMLSRLTSPTEVGLYAAALRLVTMAQELPKAITTTLFPKLSALYASSQTTLRRVSLHTCAWLVFLTVTMSATLVLIGPLIIKIVFSSRFLPAANLLNILAWSLLPFGLMKLLGSLLIVSHNQKTDLVINGVALAANIALNLLLIPEHGPAGAAFATVTAITLAAIIRGVIVLRPGGLLHLETAVPTAEDNLGIR